MTDAAILEAPARVAQVWLVVGDEPTREPLLRAIARETGGIPRIFASPRGAIAALRGGEPPPGLVVSGLYYEGIDGFDLIREMAALAIPPALYLVSRQQRAVVRAASALAQERGLTVAGQSSFPLDPDAVANAIERFWRQGDTRRAAVPKPPLDAAALQSLIDQRRIRAFLQPKVRLDSGEVVGFEALMRAQGEDGHIIGPDQLIDPLVASGRLADATLQVFSETVAVLGECLDEGFPISASINVSLGLMSDTLFCDELLDIVDGVGIDPSWLTLEVTEGEAMSDLASVTERTARIRMRGFNLSIDDFGTAYSSFLQLARLPFSEMKIERAFVSQVHQDPLKEAIVATCATLGTRLGLSVVAEGVESPLELRAVRAAGCTHAQGFLVARPIPSRSVRAWLRDCQGVAGAAAAELHSD